MTLSPQRQPRPAYCDDYNDDENALVPGTRQTAIVTATANVALKRSKPDIPKLKIPGRDEASDSGYSSQTAATVGKGDSIIQTSKAIVDQPIPESASSSSTHYKMTLPTMPEKGKERSKGEKKSSIQSSLKNMLPFNKRPKPVTWDFPPTLCDSPDCTECAENSRHPRAPVMATSVPARRASTSRPPPLPKGSSSPSKKAAPAFRSQEVPAPVRAQPPTQARPRPEYAHSYTEQRPASVHTSSPPYPFSYPTSYTIAQTHQTLHPYAHACVQTPTAQGRLAHYPAESYFDPQVQFQPHLQHQPQPQLQLQEWSNPSYPRAQRPRRATVYNDMLINNRAGRTYAIPLGNPNLQLIDRRRSVHRDSEDYRFNQEQELYSTEHPPRRRQSVQPQSRPPNIHFATTPAKVPQLHHPRVHYNDDHLQERSLRKQSLEDSRPASRSALAPKRNSAVIAADPLAKQRLPLTAHREPSPVKRNRNRPASFHETIGGLDDKIHQAEAYQTAQTKNRGVVPVKHPTIEDTKKKGRKVQTINSGVSEAGSKNSESSDGKNKGTLKPLRQRRESDLRSRRSENVEEEGLNVRFNAGQSIQLEFKGNTGNGRLIEFKPSLDGDGEVQLMIGGKGGQSRNRYSSVVSSGSRRGRSGTSRDTNYREEPAGRLGRDVSRVKEEKEEKEMKHELEPRRTRDEGTNTAETTQTNRTSNERSPEEDRLNRFQSVGRRKPSISHSVPPSRVDRNRPEGRMN